MPIRAVGDLGDAHSFAMTEDEWAQLKATYRATNLRMPCCGVAAIPKTSTLGNYFFAHARRGECATADESPEHLYCKTLIARAAAEAGWTVTTERPGASPEGEAWIADVFCEKGDVRLAFEVQMSPQSDQETERRQERYWASGVRSAWFFGARARRGSTPFGKQTPVFKLKPVVVGETPCVEEFTVSLPEFVKGMLHKRLRWTVPMLSCPHYVEFFEDVCWSCKKPVRQSFDHLPASQAPLGELLTEETIHEGRWDPPAYTAARLSDILEALNAQVSVDELLAHGLNPIGPHDVFKGKPSKFPYCNLCRHCGKPQGNERIWQRILDDRRAEVLHRQDGGAEGDLLGEAASPEAVLKFGLAVIPRNIPGEGRWEFGEQATSSG